MKYHPLLDPSEKLLIGQTTIPQIGETEKHNLAQQQPISRNILGKT